MSYDVFHICKSFEYLIGWMSSIYVLVIVIFKKKKWQLEWEEARRICLVEVWGAFIEHAFGYILLVTQSVIFSISFEQ